MPLDPRIILGGEAPKIRSAAEAQMDRFKLKQAQQAITLNDQEIAKGQQTTPQTQSDEQLLQEVIQEAGGDPAKVGYALLTRGKFKQAMDFIKGWDDHIAATKPPDPPRPVDVKTREVKVKNADGSETIKIVADTPDQEFTSAAPNPTDQRETRSLDVQAAEALARGDTAAYNRIIKTRTDLARAGQRPLAASGGGGTGGGASSDVKESVKGMKDGTLPPILPGRASKDYTALLAEAHRQGYDLAGAATDWVATQKHIASMNGAQQLRLNQAVGQLPELLDSIDALAEKWKGGRFPILNRVNLALAKGGAFGNDVASVATKLDAQIADVTADLGTVYMGGNSPTDHALSLAEKALRADWDKTVLKSMTALARDNVRIRKNSINNTGVQGASADNPYAPPQQTAPPPAVTAQEGATKPIPGFPGTEQTFKNGKWIRTK